MFGAISFYDEVPGWHLIMDETYIAQGSRKIAATGPGESELSDRSLNYEGIRTWCGGIEAIPKGFTTNLNR